MSATYNTLYRQFVNELNESNYRSGELMSIDLRRKWDACTELLHLEIFHRRCTDSNLPQELFTWVFRRMHALHVAGTCY